MSCEKSQFYNSETDECKDCDESCLTCNKNGCLECANNQMFKIDGGQCAFCPFNQVMKSGFCQQCNEIENQENEVCIANENKLLCNLEESQQLNKDDQQSNLLYLNLETLQCQQQCETYQIPVMIWNHSEFPLKTFAYCRSNEIYVDASSTSYYELGTIQFPYKSLQQALIEMYNYFNPLRDQTEQFQILLRSYDKYDNGNQEQNQQDSIIDPNKSTRILQILEPEKATIQFVRGTNCTYHKKKSTRFSIIQNEDYDISKITQNSTEPDGSYVSTTQSFKVIEIVNITGMIVFNNVEFYTSNTLIASETLLNLYISNSLIQTDLMTEVFLIETDCSLLENNQEIRGNIDLKNVTIQGNKLYTSTHNLFDFETPFNISIDNVTFNTFNFVQGNEDGILHIRSSEECWNAIDSESKLILKSNRKIQFTNILIKNDYSNQNQASQSLQFYFDIQKEILRFEEVEQGRTNDHEDLRSLNNNENNQDFLIVYQELEFLIANITIRNVVSARSFQSFLSTTNLPSYAVFELKNLYFNNTNIYQNHGILNDGEISTFILENSTFRYQKCSNTNQIIMRNLQFSNIKYVNSTEKGTFLIKIDKIVLEDEIYKNSIIQNISMRSSNINFLSFNGFNDKELSQNQSATHKLSMKELVLTNNVYKGVSAILYFDEYFQESNSQVEITDSIFSQTNYSTIGVGMIMHVKCNMLNPIVVKDSIFQDFYFGIFVFEASEKFRVDVPLTVIFQNVTLNSTISYFNSIVTVRTNTKFMIYDSFIRNSLNTKRGGFVIADYREAYVLIKNCVFQIIVGFNGGVFFAHYGSVVEIDNCTFSECAGVQNGLASVENSGYFIIKNSLFNSVYALKNSLLGITDSFNVVSSIFNSTFIKNEIIDLKTFQAKFVPSYYLPIFLNDVADIYMRVQVGERYVSKIMRSNLVIDNCTFIQERRFMDIYLSNFLFSFRQDSIITMDDIRFYNVNMQVFFIKDSIILINKTYVINNTLAGSKDQLLRLDSSSMTLQNSRFLNITKRSTDVIINILRCNNVKLSHVKFENISANQMNLYQSSLNLNNVTFKNPYSSYTGIFSRFQLLNYRAILAEDSVFNIQNSSFYNMQTLSDGGVMRLQNSNLTINNSFAPLFDNFTQSFGMYNYAPYGSNVASYPVGVRLIDIDQTDHIASGQLYMGTIMVELIDVNGNRLNTDSLSNIQIKSFDGVGIIMGKRQVQVVNGVATFSNLYFSAVPGSQQVTYQFFSPNINTAQLYQILPQIPRDQINNETIQLNFRECLEGEIIIDDQCFECEGGSYSLYLGATKCNECLDNADCLGGSQLSVKPGFWKSSYDSTQIIECLNPGACLGGVILNQNSSPDTLCKPGYGGNLCEICVVYNGLKYNKISTNECGQCPQMNLAILTMAGLVLALIAVLSVLIYLNLRSTKESELNVLLRIMTNYLQIMTTAAAFNLDWPSAFKDYLNFFTIFGETFEGFTNFDCFIEYLGVDNISSDSSNYYYKALFISFLPILIISVYAVVLVIVNKFRKAGKKNLKNQIIVSCVVVLFTIHPTLTKFLFGLYNCIEINKDEYYLKNDLQLRCWSGPHLRWTLTIGLPAIGVWVVGAPLFLLREYMATCSVFFASLFFVNDEISDTIKFIAIAIIIMFNVNFYALWILGITDCSKHRYIVFINQLLRRVLRPLYKYDLPQLLQSSQGLGNSNKTIQFLKAHDKQLSSQVKNENSIKHTSVLKHNNDMSKTLDLSNNNDYQIQPGNSSQIDPTNLDQPPTFNDAETKKFLIQSKNIKHVKSSSKKTKIYSNIQNLDQILDQNQKPNRYSSNNNDDRKMVQKTISNISAITDNNLLIPQQTRIDFTSSFNDQASYINNNFDQASHQIAFKSSENRLPSSNDIQQHKLFREVFMDSEKRKNEKNLYEGRKGAKRSSKPNDKSKSRVFLGGGMNDDMTKDQLQPSSMMEQSGNDYFEFLGKQKDAIKKESQIIYLNQPYNQGKNKKESDRYMMINISKNEQAQISYECRYSQRLQQNDQQQQQYV
eukprot:403364981